jgi:hypothetical protein
LVLLLFDAPDNCHYHPIGKEQPPLNTPMVWKGHAHDGGQIYIEGPVADSYGDPLLWVAGSVREGMSGGPILSRLHGLVSIITEGADLQNRSPAIPTHCCGPLLSRIRNFLGCGRYAWVLEGVAYPPDERPPAPKPDQPAPAPVKSDCDELRILIEANAKAIAALTAASKVPGPRGPPGPPGSAFDPATLTDEQIKALAKRLPPLTFQARTPKGEPYGPVVEKRLGDMIYLNSTIPTHKQ